MDAPTIQGKNIVFNNVSDTTLNAGWDRGDGEFVVVFATAAPSGDLSDGINAGSTFVADTKFGSGTSPPGYDDWYCVYNGFGASVAITGVAPGVVYTFQAFEYNGTGGEEVYLVGGGKGNPANVTTVIPQVLRRRR